MKLAGSYTFDAPRENVWELLMDPSVLQRIIPGCERLEEVGPDTYAADIKLGIANVRGDYTGTVKISDQKPPESYRLEGEGRGKPGFAKGAGCLELLDENGKTTMRYQADVQVGGPVAGIGQRLIEASAKSIINQSLKALAAELAAQNDAPQPPDEPSATADPVASTTQVAPSSAATAPTANVATSTGATSLTTVDVVRGIADDVLAEQPWMRWVLPLGGGFVLGVGVGIWIGTRQG